MSENIKVEVNVERLDNADEFDEHLRSSTTVLHDILSRENSESDFSFPCEQCHKFYKSEKTLMSHVLLKHPKDNVVVNCSYCEKSYSSRLSLEKHVRYMHRHGHRCNACYRTFPTEDLLKIHNDESCSMNEEVCNKCGKMFSNKVSLRNHTKYKHPEEIVHWCETCRRVFTTERGLNNHMSTVHTSCPTICNECDRVFSSGPALRSHTMYKHKKDTARCPHCYKMFMTPIRRDRHIKRHHQDKMLLSK